MTDDAVGELLIEVQGSNAVIDVSAIRWRCCSARKKQPRNYRYGSLEDMRRA
jgi:hypothetical protein